MKTWLTYLAALAIAGVAAAQQTAITAPLYSRNGELLFPSNTEHWVTLGASLGMGYNEQDFDPDNPGVFVLVSIEPAAYRYFLQHKQFADGTLLIRRSYPAIQRLANNRAGFVMGDALGTEVHVVDRKKFKDGFNFALFAQGQKQAPILPEANGCISCHKANAAYQNVFVQFYPDLRQHIPAATLKKFLDLGTVKLDE